MRGSPVIKVLIVLSLSICLVAFITNVMLMRQQTDLSVTPGIIEHETQSSSDTGLATLLQADQVMKSAAVTRLMQAMKEYYWRHNRWPADTASAVDGELDIDNRLIDALQVRNGVLVILLSEATGFGKRIHLTPDTRLGRFAIEWRCSTNLELGDSDRLGNRPCVQLDTTQQG